MAQTNGLLAARLLNLPTCNKIFGAGETLLLQQCNLVKANVSAILTSCGYQPHFMFKESNYTIGLDGWSIHPLADCFWQSHFVNLNGKTYAWQHNSTNGKWIEEKQAIHISNLELIAAFDDFPLNDFDFTLA